MRLTLFIALVIAGVWTYYEYKRYSKADQHNIHNKCYPVAVMVTVFLGFIFIVSIFHPSASTRYRMHKPHTHLIVNGKHVHNGLDDDNADTTKGMTFDHNGHAVYDIHTAKNAKLYFDEGYKAQKTDDGTVKKLSPKHYHVTIKFSRDLSGQDDYQLDTLVAKQPKHRTSAINLNTNDNSAEESAIDAQQEQEDKAHEQHERQLNGTVQSQIGTSAEKLNSKYPKINAKEDLVDGTFQSVMNSGNGRIHGTVGDVVHPSSNKTLIFMSVPHLDHRLMVSIIDHDDISQDKTDISTDTHWNHHVDVGDQLHVYGKDFDKGDSYHGKTVYSMSTPKYIINDGQ